MQKHHTFFVIAGIAVLVFSAAFLQAKKQHSQAASSSSSPEVEASEVNPRPTTEATAVVQTSPAPIPAPVSIAPAATPAPAAPKTVSKPQTVATAPAPATHSSSPAIVETPGIAPAPAPAANCSGGFSSEFLCLINNYRASQGLGRLGYDSALNGVAQSHATWMYQNSDMNHIGANGSTFYQRCVSAGTTCYAENIARGFTSASALFEAWRKSPAHNANMLGNYHSIGLSLVGTYSALEMR